MDALDHWKIVQELSVDEFMCLFFGLEPGTVNFYSGNPKDWPKGAEPLYRALTADILSRKLDIKFENPQIEELAYSRAFHTAEPFWTDGKLYRHQLVKWLAEKGIQSDFFNAPPAPISHQPNGMEEKTIKSVATGLVYSKLGHELWVIIPEKECSK